MPIPYFSDIFKLFSFESRPGPYEATEDDSNIEGVGVPSPEAEWSLRNASWTGGGSNTMRIQVSGRSYDFVDLTSVSYRKARYKEYDRLEIIPEVYTALNTFADEACIGAKTNVATPFGYFNIKTLAEHKDEKDKFLVYCWDFETNDYTLGWAYHPRFVKRAETVKVIFDNGVYHIVTPDHLFLTMDGEWVCAGDLVYGNKVKPFYRVSPNAAYTKFKTQQFPRIYTNKNGWIHERQFIDEWKENKNLEKYEKVSEISRLIRGGLNKKQVQKAMDIWDKTMDLILEKEGYTHNELKFLYKHHKEARTVLGVLPHGEEDVYDLSVEGHKNFATDATIVHNCQTDDNGHIFRITCSNEEIEKEANFLVHKLLRLDDEAWGRQRNMCKFGDEFLEIVIDPNKPRRGILKVQSLPADSMYRIESIKGKLFEFQQSNEGPDYESLKRTDLTHASQTQLMQATALRFHPNQIVHMRIGDSRKQFHPYGVSMIEAARGPAHQLRLMEDAMLVYRLTRAPERRVFYIDVGTLSPNRAEAQIDRMKDQFRKKKVYSPKSAISGQGAGNVEERWNPMPPDEDFIVPIRANSQTRIETLPGASALGEIDDAIYFRTRLLTALQFPRNYLTNEDPQASKLNLSQQDVRFARLIERLQKPHTQAVLEIIIRHLELRGFPSESFQDLAVRMTPPSDWRQMNRNEVTEVLFQRAATMKGSQLFSDFDIITRILGLTEDEAREIVARNKAQKWDDMKLQVVAANPEALGLVPMPAEQGQQIGAAPGGPNPMLSPDQQANQQGNVESPPVEAGGEEAVPGSKEGGVARTQSTPAESKSVEKLPEPEDDYIKKYDMEISNTKFIDQEEVDVGELGGDEEY